MGTPPGYAAFYPVDGQIADWAKESPDFERWQGLPREAEQELREYYAAVDAGMVADRTLNDDTPCLWLDSAGRCKHYEHRPETCRDAIEPGDEYCLEFRRSLPVLAE
jgi:Fe-S-cluster containining protein